MAEGPVCQALGPTRAVRLLLAAHDREACVYVHETVCPLEVSVVGGRGYEGLLGRVLGFAPLLQTLNKLLWPSTASNPG